MKKNSGFTLLEISMVLLILGSLVSLVTVGSKLIKHSNLQKIIASFQNYDTASVNFSTDYDALAGDMINAFTFFGTQCAATSATCNGDGNKHLDRCTTSATCENTRFWQHLYLGGYIPLSLSGVSANSSGVFDSTSINDTNSPVGIGTNNYIAVEYLTVSGLTFNPRMNAFSLKNTGQNSGISASDAKSMDVKIDDGAPYTGNFMTYDNLPTSCVLGDLPSASYNINNTTVQCTVYFKLSSFSK